MLPQLTSANTGGLPSPLYRSFNQQKASQKASFLFILLTGALLALSSCHKKDIVCRKTYFNPVKTTGDINGPQPVFEGEDKFGHFTSIVQDDTTVFPVIKGIATATYDNGDQVFQTHLAMFQQLNDTFFEVSGVDTIVGGTGRFVGATGHGAGHTIVNQITGIAHGIGKDTITLIEPCNCNIGQVKQNY